MKKKLVITIVMSLSMVMMTAIPTFAAEKNQTCNIKNDALFNTVLNYMNNCGGSLNSQWGDLQGMLGSLGNSQGDNSQQNNSQNDSAQNNNTQNNNSQNNNTTQNSSYTAQVVSLVNQERSAQGLSGLSSDSALAKIAQLKAEDMAKNNYFSHNSPTYGSAFDMMNQYGIKYSTAGENIAKGQKTPSAVMSGWMNSSGHRANILNSSYNKIGVGYAKDSNGNTYWVQMFIKQ